MRRNIIVVVEDEPMNRLMAVDIFERAGFEVADFGRTDEALMFAQQAPGGIAALFTDIDVPGDQDGIDLALLFADRWPHTPVMVTSGRYGGDAPEDLPPSISFVPKPWNVRALVTQMQDSVAVLIDR